ncbi:class I tRNA ligase family protein [Thermocrinis minervae]|uniref:leucine--tRNA ligase n=1 Tax=Thermocrinis minervae TaxID=381751 RepID=A0A1M6T1F9_9AQUI|nr:class I tRNA ligase family protein [Thermocrinis minervae]SHK50759.1 leucyl-tRNA synthetase [Thermocrinis minervae]
MKIGEFLKENFISVGDNVKFLLEKLDLSNDDLLRIIESRIGEPAKMSKSKANTVDPEETIQRYGADTVRLYILFAGPVEKDFEWTEEGLRGAYRFLNRLWELFHKNLDLIKDVRVSKEELSKVQGKAREVRRKTHQTLQKYLKDMEEFSFNTAIAAIMQLVGELSDLKEEEKNPMVLREAFEIVLFMLYPITPHVCEELWQKLGNEKPMVFYPFPEVDPEALRTEAIEIPVQVNGKVRSHITVHPEASQEEVLDVALKDPKISSYVQGKPIKKVFYVKGKLLSLVI